MAVFVGAAGMTSSADTPYRLTPVSASALVKPNTLAGPGAIFGKFTTSFTDGYGLRIGSEGGGGAQWDAYVNGGWMSVTAAGYLSVGVWAHVGCSFDGTTGRIYIDGVEVNTFVRAGTIVTAAQNLHIGHHQGNNIDGTIAEIAIWDVTLTAGEMAVLGKRYTPNLVRPGNIVSYWPLMGRTNPINAEPDLFGGYTATVNAGSPVPAAHPRMIRARTPRSFSGWKKPVYQTIAPDADVTDGSWTDQSGGSSLFAAIDETVPDDSDYIKSSNNPNNDIAEVGFADPSLPVDVRGRVKYRIGKSREGTLSLTVRLMEGASTRATWAHTSFGASPETFTQTLTSGEFASITDFTNLRLQFEADV